MSYPPDPHAIASRLHVILVSLTVVAIVVAGAIGSSQGMSPSTLVAATPEVPDPVAGQMEVTVDDVYGGTAARVTRPDGRSRLWALPNPAIARVVEQSEGDSIRVVVRRNPRGTTDIVRVAGRA